MRGQLALQWYSSSFFTVWKTREGEGKRKKGVPQYYFVTLAHPITKATDDQTSHPKRSISGITIFQQPFLSFIAFDIDICVNTTDTTKQFFPYYGPRMSTTTSIATVTIDIVRYIPFFILLSTFQVLLISFCRFLSIRSWIDAMPRKCSMQYSMPSYSIGFSVRWSHKHSRFSMSPWWVM